VSINEMQDGTYLVFKDPQTLEIRHTVLVTLDGTNLEWDHKPSSWRATDMPMLFLVDMETSNKSEENLCYPFPLCGNQDPLCDRLPHWQS
jgi:hypothetical protein